MNLFESDGTSRKGFGALRGGDTNDGNVILSEDDDNVTIVLTKNEWNESSNAMKTLVKFAHNKNKTKGKKMKTHKKTAIQLMFQCFTEH